MYEKLKEKLDQLLNLKAEEQILEVPEDTETEDINTKLSEIFEINLPSLPPEPDFAEAGQIWEISPDPENLGLGTGLFVLTDVREGVLMGSPLSEHVQFAGREDIYIRSDAEMPPGLAGPFLLQIWAEMPLYSDLFVRYIGKLPESLMKKLFCIREWLEGDDVKASLTGFMRPGGLSASEDDLLMEVWSIQQDKNEQPVEAIVGQRIISPEEDPRAEYRQIVLDGLQPLMNEVLVLQETKVPPPILVPDPGPPTYKPPIQPYQSSWPCLSPEAKVYVFERRASVPTSERREVFLRAAGMADELPHSIVAPVEGIGNVLIVFKPEAEDEISVGIEGENAVAFLNNSPQITILFSDGTKENLVFLHPKQWFKNRNAQIAGIEISYKRK